MRRRFLVVPSAILTICVAVTGCASGANITASGPNDGMPTPDESSGATAPDTGDSAALSQAQQWLEAVNLPAGAVPTDTPPASFNSYTGWPCGPYEELEAYWVIPGTTVLDAANWLIQNPTADLVTTSYGPFEEWGPVDSVAVGYVPTVGAQEGIVYTVAKRQDGVAVRAEIAAQTDTATCPPLPDGGMYGAPGQG